MTKAQKEFLKKFVLRDFEHLEVEGNFTRRVMRMASGAMVQLKKGRLHGLIFWYRVLQSHYECWLNALTQEQRAHPIAIYRRNILGSITSTLDTLHRIAQNLAAAQ